TPARAAEASPEPTLTLLLVNDVYLMGEVAGRGGFARLNAIVKAERARGVPVLYVHAGDTLSPSLMSGFDKGGHIVDLLNIAAPDVFVPGNHEFDFGPETFLERMRAAAFPCFAANLRDGAGGAIPGIRDRTILTLGGVRVGIVGIALASTPEKSQSGDLRFGPELATLAEQEKALRSEGADRVVAVTHTARPTDLAMLEAGYADIVLSGHDHDLVVHYDGRRVLAESSSDAHYVTAIDLFATISVQGETRAVSWRPSFRIHDSSYVVPDPETLALVRRLEADLSRRVSTVPAG
ncbi:bifunctional metallophosphatase/5'-nucleotidase, partial [Methylobacterium sp. WL122]